jgi:hypothetical protein
VLRLAARTLESEVAEILNLLVDGQKRWDETDLERRLRSPGLPVIPQLNLPPINLAQYDRLLQEVNRDPA